MIRNVILDWSGTLADDLPPVLEAMNRIFVENAYPAMSREEFGRSFSLPFDRWYAENFPDLPLHEIEEKYHAYFNPIQDRVEILPHTIAFLEFCRETGRRVFLLSSIHETHWLEQSARLGVSGFFEHAYVQVMDKKSMIREILVARDLKPEETLFAGDMTHDIETARHGGVLAVAVKTGFEPADRLLAADPDLLIAHLGHLQRLLTQMGPVLERPISTVGALIFNAAGAVLMLRTHKWSDRWGIPGGKIQRGETSEAALHREVREETGLELQRLDFLLVQDCIDSPEFERPAHFLLLNYTALAIDGPVVLNDEAEDFRWVTPDEALTMDLNQPTRFLIEAAMKRGTRHG